MYNSSASSTFVDLKEEWRASFANMDYKFYGHFAKDLVRFKNSDFMVDGAKFVRVLVGDSR
jgi:hypothetical protein